ncbi:atp-dependent helicase brm [Nicotiana attenuata]|uniref:Atp-dependent helicase brm n=1 Tax=Nicotiana attenuata TaxID=49451 RepID=A0A1J6K3B3_NICAT|nr:atp-dependent helicase brm [Nicotiana attenuata]
MEAQHTAVVKLVVLWCRQVLQRTLLEVSLKPMPRDETEGIPGPLNDIRGYNHGMNGFGTGALVASSNLGINSRNPGQNKRHKLIDEMEPDPSPLQKLKTRGAPAGEDAKAKNHMAQRETRFGGSSGRELSQQDDSRPFTHPGELVICKKKRKDR